MVRVFAYASLAFLALAPAPQWLLTEGVPFRCDSRFPAFMDLVIGGGEVEAMGVPGSFREIPQSGRYPDHCAIPARFKRGR